MRPGGLFAVLAVLVGSVAVEASDEPRMRIGDLLWSRRIDADEALATKSRIVPASDGKTLFLPFVDRVLAVSLETGEPAWPTGRAGDDGNILPLPARIRSRTAGGVTTAVLSAGRLFTVTGIADAGSVPVVSAFDVATAEGKLLWSQGIEGTIARAGWRATGQAVVIGDRLWLSLREREGESRLAVASLSLVDGTASPIFRIDSGERPPTEAAAKNPIALQLAADSLLCLTSGGRLTRLRTADQKVVWQSSFGRTPNSDPAVAPSIALGEDVVCAIGPETRLTAGDLQSGRMTWSVELEDDRSTVSSGPAGLVLVADRSLNAVDARTGERRWLFSLNDAGGVGAGQPAVENNLIFWSTRDELFVLDAVTGGVLDRRRLSSLGPIDGGDVFLTPDTLVLIGGERVSVFQRR